MTEVNSIDDWITNIRAPYDDLPMSLTLDIEQKLLPELAQWKRVVNVLRQEYISRPSNELPSEFDELAGGKNVIPTLWAKKYMTEREVDVVHKLFAASAPMLADIAHRYWNTHSQTASSSMTLHDVLDYLPIVFLYVLGSYEAGRSRDNTSGEDFSDTDSGARLSTWLHLESKRHINNYIRQAGYSVNQTSSYYHRVRSQVKQVIHDKEKSGESVSDEHIADELEDTYYGRTVNKSTLIKRIRDVRKNTTLRSIDENMSTSSDSSYTLQDQLFDSQPSREGVSDIQEYVFNRFKTDSVMTGIATKLLRTEEDLSVEEMSYIS